DPVLDLHLRVGRESDIAVAADQRDNDDTLLVEERLPSRTSSRDDHTGLDRLIERLHRQVGNGPCLAAGAEAVYPGGGCCLRRHNLSLFGYRLHAWCAITRWLAARTARRRRPR